MLRRISVFLLAVLLVLSLAGNVALAQPANRDDCEPDDPDLLCDKGQPGADEDKVTGPAAIPEGWGSVVTQTAIPNEEEGVEAGTFGEHASDPPGDEPRDGLGNVAGNDQGDEDTDNCGPGDVEDPETGGTNCDLGDNVGDHACIADLRFQADCTLKPGSTAPIPEKA